MGDGHGAPQRFFIHVGLPKTGTSYLQDVLFASRPALREQGLELLPKRRHGHFELALKVRGLLRSFDDPHTSGVLDRFAAQARASTAPTALLTQEAFAASTPRAVRSLLEPLDGYEVHVVVTTRDLGRQVPSAWQQGIKGRREVGYPEFLEAVVAGTEAAADFWRNQGLTEVLDRWTTAVPPERVHVITCPPSGAPPGVLLERFCSVLGLDPSSLDTAAPTANPSLGLPQAELLRRVNVALGDRLPHSRAGYRRVARSFLSDRLLEPQRGPRPLLPAAMRGWVDEVTDAWVEHLVSGGFHVVGDLADLRAADAGFVPVLPTASDAEVAGAAVHALADILEIRDRELDEREALRRRTQELERRVAELEARPVRGALGRGLLARLVDRAGRS